MSDELHPEVSFDDLPLSDAVLDALWDMRFTKCTPIQAQCIPHILQGRDLIGIAQTGTGKTAAYLLPLLTVLARERREVGTVGCLIMAPTRELAQQIDQALQGFSYYTGIRGVAVYGGNDGAPFEQERKSFRAGADIVIATPGRLITHLQLGNLHLGHTPHIVLDEADRMLDMGFIDDIRTIIRQLPAKRQVILFSATMPPGIDVIAREVMVRPFEVRIAPSRPADGVRQTVCLCRDAAKTDVLLHIFAQRPPQCVIIFASSKQRVSRLTLALQRKGVCCAPMHADLSQSERDAAMLAFRQRRTPVLIATDIVSRGIDIEDIQMVINYDCPRDAEDYVHRVGRTARAGREGEAVTLTAPGELPLLARIERLLGESIPRRPLPSGGESTDGATTSAQKGRVERRRKPQAAQPAHAGPANSTSHQSAKGRRRGRRGGPHGGVSCQPPRR